MDTLNFVIPVFFKGAPRPSVMISGNLRTRESGLVSVYTDSHFEPLNVNDMPLDNAKKIVENNGGIWVKDNFDTLSIEHLREIKSQLPAEWIDGFNAWYNSQD